MPLTQPQKQLILSRLELLSNNKYSDVHLDELDSFKTPFTIDQCLKYFDTINIYLKSVSNNFSVFLVVQIKLNQMIMVL
jgi:hypothetical protein